MRFHGHIFAGPILPLLGVQTMSKCINIVSACSTAWLADHLLSVLVLIPVMRSSWSLEFLSVMTSLVFETLNSSSAEESGSFKMVVFPESQMLVKQGGTLSHLLRYLLTVRSSTSAAVVGIL